MKASLTTAAAAVALLVATSAGAIMHITNPDYVVIINHEYTGSETNFGGGFGRDFGDGAVGDNGAFKDTPTKPRVISCSVNDRGNCPMELQVIAGNRWPGETIYATEIVQGIQTGSFSSLIRSGDYGLYGPVAPDTPAPDPAKCIADTCDVARKTQEDTNVIQFGQVKGVVVGTKWAVSVIGGVIAAKYGGWITGATTGIGAYALLKEAGTDFLDGLDQSMKAEVAIDYQKCKKKCGG